MNFTKHQFSTIFLIIIYAVGIVGLCFTNYDKLFVKLTPITLLVTFFVLLIQVNLKWRDFLPLSIPFIAGMLTETIGVKTGLLFGEYSYGTALGPQILGVPVMIGINWMLLSYLCVTLSFELLSGKKNHILIALFGAILMVLLDIFLEPFAIKYGLWSWAEGVPPLFNYITWFIISFLVIYLLSRGNIQDRNPLSKWVYLIMVVFFILTTIF